MTRTLAELEAHFLALTEDGFKHVDTLAEAQGVMFLCPVCFGPYLEKGSEVGCHSVICWFANKGVPDSMDPKPGRWNPSGTGLNDLTFVPPGAISVLLTGGCGWHGFIENGTART